MFAGLSTDLIQYVDGILYIEVSNTQNHIMSTFRTAIHYANNYRKFNPELEGALGFVVILYDRENIPGFAFNKNTHSECLQELINALRRPENRRIRTVFAGMFNEVDESNAPELVRNN